MTTETVTTQSEPSSVPWWLILIEGIAAIIVGILLLANPGSTLAVLVRLLGIYFFVTGILSIISIFIDSTAWGWKLFAGIIGILAGFTIIEYPLWSTLLVPTTFVLVIAIFAIIIGLVNLVHAFQGAGWGKGILGVLSILLGVVLLARPILATISLPLVLGVLGIVGGVLALVNAFRLKREAESESSMTAEEAPPVPVADSAPDPALEFLGLSNQEDLEKFKQSLEYIEGIGPVYAGKLAEIGVQTPLDLLRQGSTPTGRTEISTKSGISSSLILEWINQIDLYRVKGVGSEYADLLEASGVDTVIELAQRNPKNLIQKLVEVNEEKQLVRRLPSQSQVDEWIAQAKNLPRVIQY
jgi:uncharacterized membrane protein HdeD (DUF308 family)/predicted flap endonuclease-1-like 5' DNA nuclease